MQVQHPTRFWVPRGNKAEGRSSLLARGKGRVCGPLVSGSRVSVGWGLWGVRDTPSEALSQTFSPQAPPGHVDFLFGNSLEVTPWLISN